MRCDWRPNETRIGGDCSRSIESRPRRRPETSQLNILVVPALTLTHTHTRIRLRIRLITDNKKTCVGPDWSWGSVSPDNLLQCFLGYFFFFCFFFCFFSFASFFGFSAFCFSCSVLITLCFFDKCGSSCNFKRAAHVKQTISRDSVKCLPDARRVVQKKEIERVRERMGQGDRWGVNN